MTIEYSGDVIKSFEIVEGTARLRDIFYPIGNWNLGCLGDGERRRGSITQRARGGGVDPAPAPIERIHRAIAGDDGGIVRPILAAFVVVGIVVVVFAAATIGFLILLTVLSRLGTSWLADAPRAASRTMVSKLFLVTTAVHIGIVALLAGMARRSPASPSPEPGADRFSVQPGGSHRSPGLDESAPPVPDDRR